MFPMDNEREVQIGLGGPVLQGWYSRLGPDVAVIAAPHPLMGGTMFNPVVEAMVVGFQRAGWSTLRFNYRGVGNSQGQLSGDLKLAVEDYRRAVAWVRQQGVEWLTLGGYSFGAWAAIDTFLAGDDCYCIAAVAPPIEGLVESKLERLECLFALVYGTQDPWIDGYQMMDLLTHVPQASMHVVAGADHFFGGQEHEIETYARQTAEMLNQSKAAPPETDREYENPFDDD